MPRSRIRHPVFCIVLALAGVIHLRAEEPVTLAEDTGSFTLANGLVTARIEKRSGNIVSLSYQDLDLLRGGRGYWSFAGSAKGLGMRRGTAVRTDPAVNDGARAEVSCTFSFDGKPGSLPADVDLRYALGRGENWLYVYGVWKHQPGSPAFRIGEARYALKLNADIFDYLTVDANRRRLMPTGRDWDRGTPLNLKEARRLTTGRYAGEAEHKYDYSAILADTPAYGWSSTEHGVGLWIINPNTEYLAGGPTKVELTGHLDVNSGGAPTLLNMWLGSHYGGSSLAVAQDEAWTKVVGPFLLYCNTAPDPEAMWKDALARAAREAESWPYDWVSETAYPLARDRGTVAGKIALLDPFAPRATMGNLRVGLTAPDGAAAPDWQRDSKFYQFWTRADAQGRFQIRDVRPGRYTLRAFADGVLGEFSRAEVEVAAGQKLDLGVLTWTPVRHGRPLWEIGIPNRSAEEFRHGDHYWEWGLYLKYPEEFPNDVNFVIGRSDWRRDWNYAQPPRIAADGKISDSTWSITFELAELPRGPVTLRVAFCGCRGGGHVFFSANGRSIGETGSLPEAGVMHRDGIRGYWFEREFAFEPSLLKIGTNVIQLRSRAPAWPYGVLYDYLRLEAADTPSLREATPSQAPGAK